MTTTQLRNRYVLLECIAGLLAAILSHHGINVIGLFVVWTIVLLLAFAWQLAGLLAAEIENEE